MIPVPPTDPRAHAWVPRILGQGTDLRVHHCRMSADVDELAAKQLRKLDALPIAHNVLVRVSQQQLDAAELCGEDEALEELQPHGVHVVHG